MLTIEQDVDPATYAGVPLNEVVFWHEQGLVELPAWSLTARTKAESVEDSGPDYHKDL